VIRICLVVTALFFAGVVWAGAASVGSFQLEIIAGGLLVSEIGSDVFLPIGSQYALRLKNNNDRRATARITIGANESEVVLLANSQLDVTATFEDKTTFSAGADFQIRAEFRIPADVRSWHWFGHWIESREMSVSDMDSTAIVKRPLPMVNGTAREEYVLSTTMKRVHRTFVSAFTKDTTGVLTIVVRSIP